MLLPFTLWARRDSYCALALRVGEIVVISHQIHIGTLVGLTGLLPSHFSAYINLFYYLA